MFIAVQFKDKDKNFRGKIYDFRVKTAPKIGSIIRMYSADGSKKVCNATRVKVVDVKKTSCAANQEVSYIETTLED